MVVRRLDMSRSTVVKIRECNSVLRANMLTDNDFIDIIKFVPILQHAFKINFVQKELRQLTHRKIWNLFICVEITIKRLKFGPTWNGHIKRFGSEECFLVKEVKIVLVSQIAKKLIGKTIPIEQDK